MIIVVPARGGSKRLPRKNIHPLRGKPLLAYTLEAAVGAQLDCPIYVSTDDEAIAEVARGFAGVQVVMRPAEFAQDTASTESVLLHVLDHLASDVEWVMTLPPTSPFRSAATIAQFAQAAKDAPADVDCVMSVTETRGDYWRRQADGSFVRLFPDAPRRQQEREPLFEENSAVYVTRVKALRETNIVLGRKVQAIAIAAKEGFDINTAEDLQMAEFIASCQ